MKHPDLSDCPFCGHHATMSMMFDRDERRYWLRRASCDMCDAQITDGLGWSEYHALGPAAASIRIGEIVAAKWNARFAPTEEEVQ
jgi:hydrogenase maturation factor HypF (carbamoyltransferase family)